MGIAKISLSHPIFNIQDKIIIAIVIIENNMNLKFLLLKIVRKIKSIITIDKINNKYGIKGLIIFLFLR